MEYIVTAEYICASCRNPVEVRPSVRMPGERFVVQLCPQCFGEYEEQQAHELKDLESECDSLSEENENLEYKIAELEDEIRRLKNGDDEDA